MLLQSGEYNKLAMYGGAVAGAVFIFLKAKTVTATVFAVIFALSILAFRLVNGKTKPYFRLASRILVFMLIGLWAVQTAKTLYRNPSEKILKEYSREQCELVCEIDYISSHGAGYANYDAKLIFIDGSTARSAFGIYPKIRITSFGAELLETGDIVKFIAVPEKPAEITAGGFEERRYLESQKIFIICTAQGEFEYITHSERTPIERLRAKISEGISTYVGGEYKAAIAKCMLIGDKSGVDSYLKDIFRASGISHVLSVSGMHLSILFYAVSALLGIGKNKRRRRTGIAEAASCIIALAYMVIADFKPSIMRAGFMLIISNIFSLTEYYYSKTVPQDIRGYPKRYGTFNSLSSLLGAAAIICVISPYSVYDIGFQLSFLSSLGIVMTMAMFNENKKKIKPKLLHPVYISLLITASAVAFTMPVCVYNFGQLSSVSAIANLLIAPLMTPLLVLLLFLAIFSLLPASFVTVSLCTLFGELCGFIAGLCIRIAQIFSGFRFSVLLAEDSFAVNMIFAAFMVCIVISAFVHYDRISHGATACIIAFSFLCFTMYFTNTAINYFQPKLSLCTLKGLPYAGISYADKRIVINSSDGLTSRHTELALLGEQLYDTDNIYVANLCSDSDFDALLGSIEIFDEYAGIDVLLVPDTEACAATGADSSKYKELVAKLYEKDYPIDFYNSSFTVSGLTVKSEFSQDCTIFTFGDYALVYSDSYDEGFASHAAEDAEYCIYFCEKATKTDNSDYTCDARLFVPSSLSGKISGSEKIPATKPAMLCDE